MTMQSKLGEGTSVIVRMPVLVRPVEAAPLPRTAGR
jgi:hypothetical protein